MMSGGVTFALPGFASVGQVGAGDELHVAASAAAPPFRRCWPGVRPMMAPDRAAAGMRLAEQRRAEAEHRTKRVDVGQRRCRLRSARSLCPTLVARAEQRREVVDRRKSAGTTARRRPQSNTRRDARPRIRARRSRATRRRRAPPASTPPECAVADIRIVRGAVDVEGGISWRTPCAQRPRCRKRDRRAAVDTVDGEALRPATRRDRVDVLLRHPMGAPSLALATAVLRRAGSC